MKQKKQIGYHVQRIGDPVSLEPNVLPKLSQPKRTEVASRTIQISKVDEKITLFIEVLFSFPLSLFFYLL